MRLELPWQGGGLRSAQSWKGWLHTHTTWPHAEPCRLRTFLLGKHCCSTVWPYLLDSRITEEEGFFLLLHQKWIIHQSCLHLIDAAPSHHLSFTPFSTVFFPWHLSFLYVFVYICVCTLLSACTDHTGNGPIYNSFSSVYLFIIFGCNESSFLCGLSLVVTSRGYSIVVHSSLITAASHCRAYILWFRPSVVVACQFIPCGMWDLPRPGIDPMSPALEDRFLTTGPPGKSLHL